LGTAFIMPDKGKVERPYRYIREDFFLARSFRNLDDLNAQLRHWLDTVANPRLHATTGRVVDEAFAEEKPHLQPLPLVPFRSVLRLERRVSHEGTVSVGGNFYSVPDTTRKRVLDATMRLRPPRRWNRMGMRTISVLPSSRASALCVMPRSSLPAAARRHAGQGARAGVALAANA
jgi:hypothetical protein